LIRSANPAASVFMGTFQAANNRFSVTLDPHIGEISLWVSKLSADVIEEVSN
jgi:hypothetical protein